MTTAFMLHGRVRLCRACVAKSSASTYPSVLRPARPRIHPVQQSIRRGTHRFFRLSRDQGARHAVHARYRFPLYRHYEDVRKDLGELAVGHPGASRCTRSTLRRSLTNSRRIARSFRAGILVARILVKSFRLALRAARQTFRIICAFKHEAKGDTGGNFARNG
jgi:hypothetical protein